jgi:hypothetical protein
MDRDFGAREACEFTRKVDFPAPPKDAGAFDSAFEN